MVSFLLGLPLTPAVKMLERVFMQPPLAAQEACRGLRQEGQDPSGVEVARRWVAFQGRRQRCEDVWRGDMPFHAHQGERSP